MEEKGVFWNVADSYVRQNREGKITSLTICSPKKDDEDSVQLTFSIKDTELIRVKLEVTEVAGLSEAVHMNRPWSAFHSFTQADGSKMETSIDYKDCFINTQRGQAKIALKLTENERMSMALTLRGLHFFSIERKCKPK